MTTNIRCYACGQFFEKRLQECPECETPIRSTNIALLSQRCASNLNAHAAHAVKHT